MQKSTNSMYGEWETDNLELNYNSKSSINEKKMLREISHDEKTPKKHDFLIQNEIHEKIRNDQDYDDWSYGTEPSWGHMW